MTTALWSQPHHDGSQPCVPDPHPTRGGTVDVFRRVPRTSGVAGATDDCHSSCGPAFGLWRLAQGRRA